LTGEQGKPNSQKRRWDRGGGWGGGDKTKTGGDLEGKRGWAKGETRSCVSKLGSMGVPDKKKKRGQEEKGGKTISESKLKVEGLTTREPTGHYTKKKKSA